MAASNADILTLAKAGFNARQIAVILGETDNKNEAEHVLTPDAKTLAENLKGASPSPTPDPKADAKADAKDENNNNDLIEAMNAKFDQMIQLMQAQNLKDSQQPKQESVDDIIAEIINPKGGK